MEEVNKEELIKEIRSFEANNEKLVSNITRLQVGNKRLRLEYAVLLEQLERASQHQERHSIEELPTLKNLTKDLNVATNKILHYVVDSVSKPSEQKKQEFIDSFIETHVNLSKGVVDEKKNLNIKNSLKEAILEAALIHNKMKGTMVRARGTRKKRTEKEESVKEEPLLKKPKHEEHEVKNTAGDDNSKEESIVIQSNNEISNNKENEIKDHTDVENILSKEEHNEEADNVSEYKAEDEIREHEKPLESTTEQTSVRI